MELLSRATNGSHFEVYILCTLENKISLFLKIYRNKLLLLSFVVRNRMVKHNEKMSQRFLMKL